MPTRIYFTGREHSLRVTQEPEQVVQALGQHDGIAQLDGDGQGHDGPVYVNRATIAFFEPMTDRSGVAQFVG
jgi:hypothetical protein